MPSEFSESLLAELQAGLRELELRSQSRTLVKNTGVNLCSNDYLGLANNPALKQAVIEAMVKATRIGGTGSRLLSGHAAVWNELEEEFAAFAGSEAALYFDSGYAANIGLLTSLANKDDVIFSDALNHASIIDGIRLSGARKIIYPHRNFNALESSRWRKSMVPIWLSTKRTPPPCTDRVGAEFPRNSWPTGACSLPCTLAAKPWQAPAQSSVEWRCSVSICSITRALLFSAPPCPRTWLNKFERRYVWPLEWTKSERNYFRDRKTSRNPCSTTVGKRLPRPRKSFPP